MSLSIKKKVFFQQDSVAVGAFRDLYDCLWRHMPSEFLDCADPITIHIRNGITTETGD